MVTRKLAPVGDVVVCGSVAYPSRISAAVAEVRARGAARVLYPARGDGGTAAGWAARILVADLVVVVRKPDGSLGSSTVAELEVALDAGRPVEFTGAVQ